MDQPVLVKSNPYYNFQRYPSLTCLFTDCSCNTIGTSGGSTSCSDTSGDCTCDTFNGYTGLKCDDCVSGFYLSGDGQTCIGKISSTFQLSKKYSFHKMDLLKVVCAIMVELVEV